MPQSTSLGQAVDQSQEYLAALVSCHKIPCNHDEFLRFRNELYAEAFLYGEHIYPLTLALVERIRLMVREFEQLDDLKDFNIIADRFLGDCVDQRKKANKLIAQHTFVLGNLLNLQLRLEEWQERLEKEYREHQHEEVQRKRDILKRYLKAVFAVLLAPECAIVEWQQIKNQKRNVEGQEEALALARLAVGCLLKCYECFRAELHAVGDAVTKIQQEFSGVVGAGKKATTIEVEDVAVVYFKIAKNSAKEVRIQCDRFQTTKMSYGEAVGAIRAKDAVDERYQRDWLRRLQELSISSQ